MLCENSGGGGNHVSGCSACDRTRLPLGFRSFSSLGYWGLRFNRQLHSHESCDHASTARMMMVMMTMMMMMAHIQTTITIPVRVALSVP